MTITSEVTAIQVPGNGSGTVFAAPMKIFAATDLVVGFIVNSLYVLQTSGYNVTNIDTNGGCTVTFTTPPPLGTLVDIRTDIPETQGTEFANLGSYLPESTTDTCDRIVRMVQDLSRQTYNFGIHGPDTESTPWTALPPSASRAGGALVFDDGGLPTIGIPVTQTITGPLILSLLTAENLGGVENPQDSIESAASVLPTFYTYHTSPKRDVRRYLTAWDDASNQTTGLQTAVNLAYAQKGRLIFPSGLNIKSGQVSLTMAGNRLTQGLAIEGPGWNGANITQVGLPGSIFSFSGATPTGNPNEAPLVMEGFSLIGNGKTANGITLNGISYWRMNGVQVRGFDRGFNLQSALVGQINGCMSNENVYGLIAEKNGTGSGCNRISITDSQFNINSTFGVWLASGSGWKLKGLDIEANGTTGNVNTGGMRILATIDDEFGFSIVALDTCWFEQNFGTTFLVDSTSGLFLAMRDSQLLSAEAHLEISILGAAAVQIENSFSPGGAGDIWNITCGELIMDNVEVTTLTDSGVTYPTYHNVRTSTTNQVSGRETSANLTITGMNPAVTAVLANFYQQGKDITCELLAPIAGTSNTNACTLTGIPTNLCPASGTRGINLSVQNNGSTQGQTGSLDSTGVLTLNWNGSATGFTTSGGKGLPIQSFRWRIA